MPAEPAAPRILIVDDTPATVRLLTAYLVSAGYEVLTATTGHEALDLVVLARPALVLLDLAGTELDRRKLCLQIRSAAAGCSTPVLVSAEGKLHGVPDHEVLDKPYRRAELLLRVGSMLRIRALGEQLAEKTMELDDTRALLRRHAVLDPLTRLHNRVCLERFVARAVDRAERRASELSVLMLAIGGFREFNEREGHQAGDALLAQVAGALREHTPPDGLSARYGDRRFVVVLPGTGLERAAGVAADLQASLARLSTPRPELLRFDLGQASYPGDAGGACGLLRAAERRSDPASRLPPDDRAGCAIPLVP